MAHWLLKTEPEEFSWDDLKGKGAKGELWTGVRNHTAKKNLTVMKKGDRAFFYHTGEEKQVVGIAEVIREAHPDPTANKGEPWVVVDVKADEALSKPVTLAAIKADARFKDMALVKYGRLSVQPVSPEHWKAICKLGGAKG